VSSAISHELKNPLAVIKGALCLLKIYSEKLESEQDTDINEAINTADSAVKSAEKIVYNLLDFSSKTQDEVHETDVGQIIEQILMFFAKDRVARNLTVKTSFSPKPLIYTGYAEPLKNILQNIITNGLAALQSGGTLTISGCYVTDGQEMKLTIEDDGIGIPKKHLDMIFQPFFTTGMGGQGTGLGLWVTRHLVERMHGSISVESNPGEGSIFTILLPQANKDQKES